MKADPAPVPKILVLASGSGTNLQALIDATRERDFPGEIIAVGCNKPGAFALERAAQAKPELEFVETRWRCTFDDPHMRLRDGLVNFQPVAQGEVLSAPSTPEITAPCDGFLLFPKYPGYQADGSAIEPRPGEIVRIVAPLAQHPLDLWDVSGS